MNDASRAEAEIEELLGAYALDAVDPDERQRVEDHLAGCPRCRAELAGHLEVASWMAGGGSRAPEGVWDRIASELDDQVPAMRLTSDDLAAARQQALTPTSAPAPGPAPATGPAPDGGAEVVDLASRRRSTVTRALTAAVAVAAAVILVLGIVVARQDNRIGDMEAELAAVDLNRAFGQAMGDPGSTKVQLAAPDGGETAAQVVVTEDGVGFVSDATLPVLPADRTYQLWGIEGDRVISLGIIGPDPTLNAFTTGGATFTTYALTEEEAGGVPQSANQPVALGTV